MAKSSCVVMTTKWPSWVEGGAGSEEMLSNIHDGILVENTDISGDYFSIYDIHFLFWGY